MEKQQHGVTAYANGSCRCARICRPAWASYHRNRRRKATTPGTRRRATRGKYVERAEYYLDKQPEIRVALTGLGEQILRQAEQHTRKNVNDIVEQALRAVGAHGFAFDDEQAVA